MNKLHFLKKTHPIGIIIDDGGMTTARLTALEAAGLDENSVTFTRIEETTYLGRKLYEVEFTGDELHHEFYIDAETREIVGQDFKPIEI
ncbi:MAG: hypothetical protein EOM54_09175 [Clostridia bacterium]|nr:hypothetical protein [Clostridia bacterium]